MSGLELESDEPDLNPGSVTYLLWDLEEVISLGLSLFICEMWG